MPVFLRIVDNPSHIHNHKQNKVPLREEGVDPALIGTKATDGQDDRFMWMAPASEGYTPFGKEEWEQIVKGTARL